MENILCDDSSPDAARWLAAEAADFRAIRLARGRDSPISSARQAASRARSWRTTAALLPNRSPRGCAIPTTALAGPTTAGDPARVTPRTFPRIKRVMSQGSCAAAAYAIDCEESAQDILAAPPTRLQLQPSKVGSRRELSGRLRQQDHIRRGSLGGGGLPAGITNLPCSRQRKNSTADGTPRCQQE